MRFIDCDPLGHLTNSRYIDYMLNAREDHVEKFYDFNITEHALATGCSFIALQNRIAYLREVRYNKDVVISSKILSMDGKTAEIEVLMSDIEEKTVHAVLWCKVIYFNAMTRSAQNPPDEIVKKFEPFLVDVPYKSFDDAVTYWRNENKKARI